MKLMHFKKLGTLHKFCSSKSCFEKNSVLERVALIKLVFHWISVSALLFREGQTPK